jgi:hypothetical protein
MLFDVLTAICAYNPNHNDDSLSTRLLAKHIIFLDIFCFQFQVLSEGWNLLSVDLGSGSVALAQPLKWQGGVKPDLLLCMA